MNPVTRARLRTQRISHPFKGAPEDVIRLLGAVQAQDYLGAKWSVGLRLRDVTDAEVQRACDDGRILRTHMLRPTWHFVLPEDIRWMQSLTAPRVIAQNASMSRKLGIDARVIGRAKEVIVKELEGGRARTREEVSEALEKAGIRPVAGQRLSYIVMHAELECLICSGPRRGKQSTYALVDERAPADGSGSIDRDEALARLATRYFTGHGPATVRDFARWSSLTIAEAGRAAEAVGSVLKRENLEDLVHWSSPDAPPRGRTVRRAHLLCVYDEYVNGYRDRSALGTAEFASMIVARGAAVTQVIVIDGQVLGTWSRTFSRETVDITLDPFIKLSREQMRLLEPAAKAYGAFLGLMARVALKGAKHMAPRGT